MLYQLKLHHIHTHTKEIDWEKKRDMNRMAKVSVQSFFNNSNGKICEVFSFSEIASFRWQIVNATTATEKKRWDSIGTKSKYDLS